MAARPPELRHSKTTRNLSAREAEVLRRTTLGWTNAQIAEHLGITVHTVKFHLSSIYQKLGVANRTEAAVTLLVQQAGRLEGGARGSNGP